MLIIKEAFEETRLEQIRALYEAAFPISERKPFSIILEKRAQGAAEILSIEDDKKRFRGLLITMLHKDMVLVDYFAIDEESRGIGIGSDVLKLFMARYANKRIFLEIESTASESAEDYDTKIRRKAFYEKNGLTSQGYLVNQLGVELEIMTFHCNIPYEEYYEMLVHVYEELMRDKVHFIRNI